MNFNDFSNTLICKLQLFAGNEYVVETHDVSKNNGVTLHGIMAKKPDALACPTFYIDDMYDEELTAQEIEYLALKVHRAFIETSFECGFDVEEFLNYEKMAPLICLKLVNAELNKDLLFDVPHRRFHNLAIVYYIYVENKALGDFGSVLIRNQHMEDWGKSEEELYRTALENMPKIFPKKVASIVSILNEYYGKNFMEEESPLYILTNELKTFGASTILYPGILDELAEKFNEDFYIIPSSVHELLILPESALDNPQNMLDITEEINRSQVDEKEVLADSLYKYSIKDKEIIWIG